MRVRVAAHDSDRRRALVDRVRRDRRVGPREQILDGIFRGGAAAGIAAHAAAKSFVDAIAAGGRRRGAADFPAEFIVEHSSSLAVFGADAEYSRFGTRRCIAAAEISRTAGVDDGAADSAVLALGTRILFLLASCGGVSDARVGLCADDYVFHADARQGLLFCGGVSDGARRWRSDERDFFRVGTIRNAAKTACQITRRDIGGGDRSVVVGGAAGSARLSN